MFEWNLGILALQNTENGLLNAELWIFRFLLGFFMAHYAHFKFKAFLWLATLIFCVARVFGSLFFGFYSLL